MSLGIKEHLGKSFLFDLKPIDPPDSIEHGLYVKQVHIGKLLAGAADNEMPSILLQHISKNPEFHNDLCKGLLFSILSASSLLSSNYFQLLHSITNDSWATSVSILRYFTFTKFSELKSEVKQNLLELVSRIVALNGRGVDGLVVGLLRQIRAGDHGRENSDLCTALLTMIKGNREWVYGQPGLIPFVFYTFARLAAEEGLEQKVLEMSSSLCADMLKSRYRECASIGRDFARAIQGISHLECMKHFWLWFCKPTEPGNTLSMPMSQVLAQPTHKKYVACRLTPGMETELLYMMENVKSGRQSFYEGWFQDVHFPKGPSDDPNALISDLIRYIVVVHHPSNAILSSNFVQRWAVITWLYRQIIHEKAAFEALLSVFLDWFFFEPTVDSIMNIEPGCLILCKAITKLPAISIGALSYLSYYRHQFGDHPATEIQRCIDLSMRVCIEKGVVSSLECLLGSSTLDPLSKQLVATLFPTCLNKTAPHVAVSDPRSRSNSGSIKSSVEPSKVPSPKESPSGEMDTEDEYEVEEAFAVFEDYDLLKQKIKILTSSSEASDEILKALIDRLQSLEPKLYEAKLVREGDSLRFLKSQNARTRVHLGSDSTLSSSESLVSLPKTMAEFGKFRSVLLTTPDHVEFPSSCFGDLISSSLAYSPTEQLWFWKSIVLIIHTIPVGKLRPIPDTLRVGFHFISDEHEILSTGMHDALVALNSRLPVIPTIFDGLEDLDSEAFQMFVEQAILMSRKD